MSGYSTLLEKLLAEAKTRIAELEARNSLCAVCKGSGEGTAISQELGPNAYEYDCLCECCKGTGLASRECRLLTNDEMREVYRNTTVYTINAALQRKFAEVNGLKVKP